MLRMLGWVAAVNAALLREVRASRLESQGDVPMRWGRQRGLVAVHAVEVRLQAVALVRHADGLVRHVLCLVEYLLSACGLHYGLGDQLDTRLDEEVLEQVFYVVSAHLQGQSMHRSARAPRRPPQARPLCQ